MINKRPEHQNMPNITIKYLIELRNYINYYK